MVFYTAQLIVGPVKISPNLLRQTFGERFLKNGVAYDFANEFESLSIPIETVQTYAGRFYKRMMWSSILTYESCLRC